MNAISVNNVMAMRAAVLQRNAAVRDAAMAPNPSNARGAERLGFEATFNAIVQKNTGPGGAIETAPVTQADGAWQPGFAAALKGALQNVNELGAQEDAAAEAYERGDTTDIVEVMLAGQRSSIAFEATLQVRNKLLSAYKDIMNMPV